MRRNSVLSNTYLGYIAYEPALAVERKSMKNVKLQASVFAVSCCDILSYCAASNTCSFWRQYLEANKHSSEGYHPFLADSS